jgi:membrane fusion protein (multidrug efflux system)
MMKIPMNSAVSRFLLFTVMAATLPALNGCDSTGEGQACPPEAALPEIRVSVQKIEPEKLRDVLILPAETEARHDVSLASECDGAVEWIGPVEGQKVKKDELLIKVDVAERQAAFDRAKATYEKASHFAERREALSSGQIVSEEDLEEALTAKALAEAGKREAKVRLEQGFIRSPIDGILDRLYVDPGEFVNRGQAVANIVDVDKIRINVNVPELDIRYLSVGQKALVTVDAYPDAEWEGEIDLVSYKADPATKTFKVRVVVDNADRRIRPGMIARCAFLRRTIEQALSVPLFSILDKGGERVIFVEEDGVAHSRTVQIGVIEGDKVQITQGIKPGENLIVKGHHNVEEGTKVVVQ